MIQECDVRGADFTFRQTKFLEDREIDIFRADSLPGIEIRVTLRPSRLPVLGRLMVQDTILITDGDGNGIAVSGDSGGPISPDTAERICWEIVEDDAERSFGYSQGRPAGEGAPDPEAFEESPTFAF